MAPNLTARDDDGTEVPLRERTVADRLRAALRDAGADDPALADELAAAVVSFVGRSHDGAAAPVPLATVDDLIERALADAGHDGAARAFARERRLRVRLRRELVVLPSDRGAADDVDDASDAARGEPWSAARWVRRLAKERDLPAAPAEEVVAAVERRLGALGLRAVSERLVRELLDAEMAERGLAVEAADEGLVVARRDVARAAESAAAPPEVALAGPLFARAALAEEDDAVVRAHRAGVLHLYGLDRPAALERLAVSARLLVDAAQDVPAARTPLAARIALERLRPHVAGAIELPDLVGGVAARATAAEDPESLAEDLLRALTFADAFEAPVAPDVEATIPIDGFAAGAAGRREAAVVDALLARLAAAPASRPGLRVVFSTDGSAGSAPEAARRLPRVASLLLDRPGSALRIRRDGGADPFLRDPAAPGARTLRVSVGRVALNLPLALLAAEGTTTKDALPLLDAPGRVALGAFHERLWRQRRGAPFGAHGVVVMFGGPGSVAVEADGQEADLEVWGLPLALDLLLRRGVTSRAQISETAARLLGYLDFLAGEEREGLKLRARLCGVVARDVRLRFHAALERRAAEAGRKDVADALKTPRGGEGVLPVVAPLFDARNAPLLGTPSAERLGPGLALSVACLPKGLGAETFAELAARTRLDRVAFVAADAGEGLFEVQEELFR